MSPRRPNHLHDDRMRLSPHPSGDDPTWVLDAEMIHEVLEVMTGLAQESVR